LSVDELEEGLLRYWRKFARIPKFRRRRRLASDESRLACRIPPLGCARAARSYEKPSVSRPRTPIFENAWQHGVDRSAPTRRQPFHAKVNQEPIPGIPPENPPLHNGISRFIKELKAVG